jgi:manganese/iron transport system ATP-binding protein
LTQARTADAASDAGVVEVRNLTVRYERHIGLEDVSFTVGVQEQVAVVGPNGAGKSTLFKAIAGIIPPASGQIVVHGHAPGVDVCVAYVQQRSAVDWSFPVSARDVVMMGRTGRIGLFRRPRRQDHDAVASALDVVGLAHLAGRQIGSLSGGEQQRMFIARALAQQAELVLMDEPLTGLDLASSHELLTVLDRLEASGVSVMVATHDLDLAAEHFDRVMLLNRRLIGIGKPSEVFTEANLRAAYGGTIRVLDSDGGRVIVGEAAGDEHSHRH